jgi:N-dimethylarginine dimethylaminohydrolase
MSAGPPDLHQTRMRPAAEPPFHDELEEVWGERWGAWDEVGRLRRVLVRRPGDEWEQITEDAWDEESQALVDPQGGWYWTAREAPDMDKVRAQHEGLVQTLRDQGVEVVVAEPLGGRYTKAVYIRDPLVTVPGGAVIGRMAVAMRRGEEADVTRIVAAEGLPILQTVTGTGTLEGGSLVKLRDGLAAFGTSIRCNEEGARQLQAVFSRLGWELLIVPLTGYTIHLDLHLTMVDVDRCLVDAPGLPFWFLEELGARGFELLHPDRDEDWALNALALGPGRILMAEGSPRTVERLTAAGIEVVTTPYDEIQKAGGGVHCSTMELLRDPAPATA